MLNYAGLFTSELWSFHGRIFYSGGVSSLWFWNQTTRENLARAQMERKVCKWMKVWFVSPKRNLPCLPRKTCVKFGRRNWWFNEIVFPDVFTEFLHGEPKRKLSIILGVKVPSISWTLLVDQLFKCDLFHFLNLWKARNISNIVVKTIFFINLPIRTSNTKH